MLEVLVVVDVDAVVGVEPWGCRWYGAATDTLGAIADAFGAVDEVGARR